MHVIHNQIELQCILKFKNKTKLSVICRSADFAHTYHFPQNVININKSKDMTLCSHYDFLPMFASRSNGQLIQELRFVKN